MQTSVGGDTKDLRPSHHVTAGGRREEERKGSGGEGYNLSQ